MLPAECFVNPQKFQEAKVHKASSLGLPDHTAISRHNFSALEREAAEAKKMGQLTFLPECKQTPKQTYTPTPNTHTHCHQWHRWYRTENAFAYHRWLLAAALKTSMQSGNGKPRDLHFGLDFKPEIWKLKGLDWEIYHYSASLSFATRHKNKPKTKQSS